LAVVVLADQVEPEQTQSMVVILSLLLLFPLVVAAGLLMQLRQFLQNPAVQVVVVPMDQTPEAQAIHLIVLHHKVTVVETELQMAQIIRVAVVAAQMP
jgi:hypothetical protein